MPDWPERRTMYTACDDTLYPISPETIERSKTLRQLEQAPAEGA